MVEDLKKGTVYVAGIVRFIKYKILWKRKYWCK